MTKSFERMRERELVSTAAVTMPKPDFSMVLNLPNIEECTENS